MLCLPTVLLLLLLLPQSLESSLSLDLRQLQESQRREYRDWLTKMHSDLQRGTWHRLECVCVCVCVHVAAY